MIVKETEALEVFSPLEVSIAVRGSRAVKLQRILPDSASKTPRIWGHSAFSKSP